MAIVLLLVGGVLFFAWFRMANKPVPEVVPQTNDLIGQALQYDEPLKITAYVPGSDGLASLQVSVKREADTQAQVRRTLEAMLAHQQASENSVLKEMRLRAFFMDSQGTGYVDLAPASETGVRASAWEELLAVYAVVNTVVQNFEEIRKIRFLLDGKETQTLTGHIDCGGTFTKRMDLVL